MMLKSPDISGQSLLAAMKQKEVDERVELDDAAVIADHLGDERESEAAAVVLG